MIRLEHVTKRWPDGRVAVDDLTIDVAEGELVVLVGPSGCGKTTTMKMINRLVEPSSGRIFIGDEDVTHADPVTLRRRIGYVIQQIGLFPHQTVAQNVGTVPKLLGWDKGRIAARVEELLSLVGLDPATYVDRYPAELSGGMRQRVAICRALIQEPGLLLMDEPFGALDALTREQMIMDLQHMWMRLRNTVLFITHGIDEAVFLADRVLVMSPRPGRVDLDLEIDIPRPRSWTDVHESPKFAEYVRRVRKIFEAKGVLTAH